MPLPLPVVNTALLRFSFILNGIVSPCAPGGSGVKLTGEPGEGYEAGAFYFRDKLSGPLSFAGDDYALLLDIDTSADRGLSIGLLVEARPYVGGAWAMAWQGVFTTAECTFDYDRCTASVSPTTDDAYRVLLENWDQEVNLLAIPDLGTTKRQQVTATLAVLASDISIEFLRVDSNEEADYFGTDGWAGFLRDTSWISGEGLSGGTRQRNVLLFRYRLRNVPMNPPQTAGGPYTPVDQSGAGWAILPNSENTTTHTVDYVKTPSISGFKAYKIGTYNDWNDVQNGASTKRYGDQLLLLPKGATPSQFGFVNAQYIEVTGPGGARNDNTAPNLNLRRSVNTPNERRLFWRFGDFKFGRCFPLLDALHYVLNKSANPMVGGVAQPAIPAVARLLPPTPALLSQFYTAATNPATGDTGTANEVPRLLLSAASDVKRYGSSEAATRVLISLKTLLADLCALHDLGWFVDPATGWLRIEHRAYAESQYGTGPKLDLTTVPRAILPHVLTTRTQQLPRYEELMIANAITIEQPTGLPETNFKSGVIDYGTQASTNTRQGQNRTSVSVARLTGDVAACVLSGDAIPDNAIVVLAPGADGRLGEANRDLSASRLVQRYYRHGRAAFMGTANGQPFLAESVKPQREQSGLSVPFCSVDTATPLARYTTNAGRDGRLAKREFNLATGVATLTIWLPIPATSRRAVLPTGRQFDNSFNKSFH